MTGIKRTNHGNIPDRLACAVSDPRRHRTCPSCGGWAPEWRCLECGVEMAEDHGQWLGIAGNPHREPGNPPLPPMNTHGFGM